VSRSGKLVSGAENGRWIVLPRSNRPQWVHPESAPPATVSAQIVRRGDGTHLA
jgi:hypothetical protein